MTRVKAGIAGVIATAVIGFGKKGIKDIFAVVLALVACVLGYNRTYYPLKSGRAYTP